MESIMNEFKKIAPYIVDAVKVRVGPDMSEIDAMAIIHEEILAYFDKQQKMAVEALTFTADQKRVFSGVMYDLLKPLTTEFVKCTNPLYDAYVAQSGKTGALNYMTNA